MAGEVLTEKETLSRLGITADQLEELISQGKLTPEIQDGTEERRFPAEQVSMLAGGDGEEAVFNGDENDVLFDLDADEESGESGPRQGEEEKGGPEDELFDFGEDSAPAQGPEKESDDGSGLDEFDFLLEEEDAEAAGGDEAGGQGAEEASAGEQDQEAAEDADFLLLDEDEDEDDAPEAPVAEDDEGDDMITEMVDVSELEGGEEDLLSDVIEDSSGDISLDDLRDSETDDSLTQEVASDITELGEETEIFDSEGATSDITQLGEEDFGEEDAAEILTDDGEHATDLDERDMMEFEGTLQPEPPFPVWAVVVLVLVMAIQMLGIIFIVENTVQSAQPSGISETLNFVRFFQ